MSNTTIIGEPPRDPWAPGLGSPPSSETEQSYSLIIRDIFFDALAHDPFFDGHFKRRTKRVPAMPEQLPYLGVYIVDETMLPDGDANGGTIRFSHTLRIGFSVIIADNDEVIAERTIDKAFWRINNRLWCDPKIMNLLNADTEANPDNIRIESLVRGMRRHNFGQAAFNQQTALAELQFDISVFYRTMWWPEITDDFLEMSVTSKIKQDAPTIRTRYFFEPRTGPIDDEE